MSKFRDGPLDEIPFPEDLFIIPLTRNEALFLDDSFTLMIEREIDDHRITAMRPVQMTAALAVPMELMEKVGRAVVFTTHPDNGDKEYESLFDLTELLMIREIASSYIKIGEEPVGYNLKRKICAVLYGDDVEREGRDRVVDSLLQDIDTDLSSSRDEVESEQKRQPDS